MPDTFRHPATLCYTDALPEPDATMIPAEDHRTRTAARRRETMRRRLLESAMLVFAEKGVDASVIDDVISTAGVSRGTFYKYFKSNRDLMVAANEELGKELLTQVLDRVAGLSDPAERLALGVRLFIETALAYPLFAHFTRSAGMASVGPRSLLLDYLPDHIRDATDQGRFCPMPLEVSLDLISGGVLFCIAHSIEGSGDDLQSRHMVAALMRGLGVPADEAWRLADREVAPMELPEDSLLCQSNLRYRP
ncbi:TetR/AcrR family transcriptional regulator [Pseudodonghicola sp.]|jgi:AcrR family transcriptional regulator|uniref:TetR/AcrR family transcriptional regulator n=1 Tax=Pseudodonghicola sp. TaxID=1969463 RepID=UPI003A96E487